MLEDIDKDTVLFAPNFDDTENEPTVLPARFPVLLVNGATGIAAGYATNIPPHNLSEVIDAAIYRMQRPKCCLLYTSAVELYDIRKIKDIDNKIETLFTKAKSYFYYSDIYEAFKIIIQYYLFAEYPNSVTAERMYYTSFLLSSKIDEILKNILFDYFFFREMNMSYSEKISEQLISYKNGSQISTIYIVFWLIYKERLLDALRYTEPVSYTHLQPGGPAEQAECADHRHRHRSD